MGSRIEELRTMEETGMTDLQFKSFLRKLVRNLEDARRAADKRETDLRLEGILQDLRRDLRG